MDGILTVWVITWRTIWPAMLAAVLLPPTVFLAGRRLGMAPALAFTLPLLGPIVIVAWSGLFWAAEELPASGVHWVSNVLAGLVVVSLALIVWVAAHYRKSPRYWAVIFAAVANAVFVLGAGAIGSMAISNSWL